jgi:hypothetical protein
MDAHVILTKYAVDDRTPTATAFSALPDAPVLPVVERRHPIATLRRLLPVRRANTAPRPAQGRERPAAPRLPAPGPLCG